MNNKKGNVNKIIFVIILFVAIISLLFLVFINNQKNEKLKKQLKVPAINYFENYMSSTTNASVYKVTLKMLKEANLEEENYHLSSFKGCDEDKTYATITLDYVTGKIKDINIKISC